MKNIWSKSSKEDIEEIFNFCEGYKKFLSMNKTERECIAFAVKIAEKFGYKNLENVIKNKQGLKPGDKIFAINMGKMIVLAHIGNDNIEKGLNIIGAHIDSPRIDLKSCPLYENSDLAFFDTHYYGGIKKYQWLALPLAFHGVVCKKDGSKLQFNIGDKPDDPVFTITDLLPHLSKNVKIENLNGEMLNILIGSMPAQSKQKMFSKNIIEYLKKQGIGLEDLISSEIEVVPAGEARDLGFDRSMILGYGQDDRICAYASLLALLSQKETPVRTSICMLVDKEEVGSYGATGMSSRFFENFIEEIVFLLGLFPISSRRALRKSFMISSDVTAAYDPNYPSPMNRETEAFLSRGVSFNKYTGSKGKSDSNDANPEFIAKIRKLLDENNICYQFTEMGKVDEGGGGTIAHIMSRYGMEVIDAGVPLLNMHAPWEVASKADIYESFKFYKIFYTLN